MAKKSSIGAILLVITAEFAMAQTDVTASKLTIAAESRTMIWNSTIVENGQMFVSAPRWTGSKGPQLALLDANHQPTPFPNVAWNAWARGKNPASAFVNINALHYERSGALFVVDTGSPTFGGDPIPHGAKIIRIDLKSRDVTRVYPLAPNVALPGSYVDDIRIHDDMAYLTDAGKPGLIILDLRTGEARRVINGMQSVTASARPIIVSGTIVMAPDGKPLKVHADPMELSPDGQYLYFAPLSGPWSRIETRWLDDPSANASDHVEPWADLPPVGGTAMAPNGDLYFTDLADNALKRRAPDGQIETIIRDRRLHWIDAPYLDSKGILWLPVPQLDRVDLFHAGTSKIVWPIQLFRLSI
ncbi:MAG: L-dopachrome tautomerase-related protein [Bradyrhizobium sp.]